MESKKDLIERLTNYLIDNSDWSDIEYILSQAYEAGFNAKKCKEDKDNPYHIDHKRQTKLDF